jgi:hypothetical protein
VRYVFLSEALHNLRSIQFLLRILGLGPVLLALSLP